MTAFDFSPGVATNHARPRALMLTSVLIGPPGNVCTLVNRNGEAASGVQRYPASFQFAELQIGAVPALAVNPEVRVVNRKVIEGALGRTSQLSILNPTSVGAYARFGSATGLRVRFFTAPVSPAR